MDIRRLCQHIDEWSEEKCVIRFLAGKGKTKYSFLGCFLLLLCHCQNSKWNGRCWSLMAGSVLDLRIINNKTLLSVTGGSVMIQMTGIKRWFYLPGIRNISIINFHQQPAAVCLQRGSHPILHSAVKHDPASVSDSQFLTMSQSWVLMLLSRSRVRS